MLNNNLLLRTITAFILLPIAFCLLIFAPVYILNIAIAILMSLAISEWLELSGEHSKYTNVAFCVKILVFSLIFTNTHNIFIDIFVILVACFWLCGLYFLRNPTLITSQSANFKILLGECLLLGFCASVSTLINTSIHGIVDSRLIITLVCLIVWGTDIGAYFVGRMFGKIRLAPNISPSKTVEGVIGGVITAIIVALIALSFSSYSIDSISIFITIIFTIILSLVSIIGDLFESVFKRHAGMKDSGKIFPGHGGVLDRIDALLSAVPVAALLNLILVK